MSNPNAYDPCAACGHPRGGARTPCPICGHDPVGDPPPFAANIVPGGGQASINANGSKFKAMPSPTPWSPATYRPTAPTTPGDLFAAMAADPAVAGAGAGIAGADGLRIWAGDPDCDLPLNRRDAVVDAFASDVRDALDVALGPEPPAATDPTDAATRWPDARRAWDGLQAALDLLMTAADPATGGRMTRLGEYALTGAALDDANRQAALVGAWLVIFQSALAKRADTDQS